MTHRSHGRSKHTHHKVYQPDFSNLDLSDRVLDGASFTKAYLYNTNFDKSKLINVKFNGASGAGASLKNSDLTNSDFRDAKFNNANFSNATITGADFSGANLSNSSFENVKWSNNSPNFTGANLEGVIMLERHIRLLNLSAAQKAQVVTVEQLEREEAAEEEEDRLIREEVNLVQEEEEGRKERERLARVETERLAKEEAGFLRQERERLIQEETRIIQEERERRLREEAESLAREEARLIQEERERLAREEAARAAMTEVEAEAEEEARRRIREEAEIEASLTLAKPFKSTTSEREETRVSTVRNTIPTGRSVIRRATANSPPRGEVLTSSQTRESIPKYYEETEAERYKQEYFENIQRRTRGKRGNRRYNVYSGVEI
jgi:hypothetical protein